jgi:PKD repeat protein
MARAAAFMFGALRVGLQRIASWVAAMSLAVVVGLSGAEQASATTSPPAVDFSCSPSCNAPVGTEITFKATTDAAKPVFSSDLNGDWIYGDATGQVATFAYQKAGIYPVSVQVTGLSTKLSNTATTTETMTSIAIGPPWASALVRPSASAQSAPVSARSGAPTETFNAVAATSPTNVWVVGSTQALTVHTLILHWNGRIWRRVLSPNVAGRRAASYFYAVAVTSRRDAWAVGGSAIGHTATLIEHWNGKAWKIVPSPSPRRDFGVLDAVAARTAKDAWAVGDVSTELGVDSRTLIEHWNGTAWRRVPSPNITSAPSGTQIKNVLNGVAAISPSNVWAVGGYQIGADPVQTLIEHWNGRRWSIVSSPDPEGTSSPATLVGIAAISRANIFAVGAFGDFREPTHTLIVRWNGTRWRRVPSPNPGSVTAVEELSAVSAVSATNAWAVGRYEDQGAGNNLTLIQRWNGRNWRAVRAPFPHGADGDSLYSVAAVSARAAWAVGTAINGPLDRPLIMRWNGIRWAIVTLPPTLASGVRP